MAAELEELKASGGLIVHDFVEALEYLPFYLTYHGLDDRFLLVSPCCYNTKPSKLMVLVTGRDSGFVGHQQQPPHCREPLVRAFADFNDSFHWRFVACS